MKIILERTRQIFLIHTGFQLSGGDFIGFDDVNKNSPAWKQNNRSEGKN